MEEPKENSYMLTVGLSDIRKKDATAIAERVSEVIEKEFADKLHGYAVAASHMKGVVVGFPR